MINDTIYAPSSGVGVSSISIIRISGNQISNIITTLTGNGLPEERKVVLRAFHDPDSGDLIDKALLVVFLSPRSFTGEDVAEIHAHGSRAVVQNFLEVLSKFSSVRSARPGEFTRKSFNNGKMNFLEVEGLSDLLKAETLIQKKSAHKIMGGVLSQKTDIWRERIIKILSYVESEIDFSEDDSMENIQHTVLENTKDLHSILERDILEFYCIEKIQENFRIVLVGRPNVGKSSFLNTLSGESRAIVSDIPGTTRDFLESRVTIEGFSVTLVDLPGIRENISDPIEKIAIERALQCIPEADMRIFFSSEQEKLCQKTLAFFMKEGDIIVFTKSDLYHLSNLSYYAVSSTLKTGFDQVLEAIKKRVKTTFDAQSDRVVVRKRHMESIINFKNSIKKTIYLLDSGYNFEILAEELRNSLDIIEELTGKITSERVMDAVFSEFCIGK